VRAFRRRPGFFAIAVTSLGMALGLSTAVFAMIDALRHPLAANEDVDRLVSLGVRGAVERQYRIATHEEMYDLVGTSAFESLTRDAFAAAFVESDQLSDRATVRYVAPNFLRVYGLQAARGRLFNDDDFGPGEVVVIKESVWKRHFRNLPDLDGAWLTIGERQYAVVGVLPPYAQGPDVLIPATENMIRSASYHSVTARLRPPATIESMQPTLRAAEERFARSRGLEVSPLRFVLTSLRPEPLKLEGFHVAMLGGAFGILLIACANVAALMLSRGVTSRRNYALHLALGARGVDLARNVIVEVALIGLAGAIAGTLLAGWSTHVLVASLPETLLNIGIPKPQWSLRVFGMVFLATSAAIAIAAAGPAWYAARTNPNEPLKDSAGTTTGRSTARFQALVVAEIAVSMVLLFGASLMAKSARLLANYDFGYDIRSIVNANVMFPVQRPMPPEDRLRAATATLERVRRMPGIADASIYSIGMPDSNAVVSDGSAQGEPTMYTGRHWSYRSVGPGFFSVFGLRVSEGRDFLEGDRERGAVILSSGAARILFPRGDAVGRSIRLGDAQSSRPWLPVIGVVPDFKLEPRDTLSDEFSPDVFVFSPETNATYVSIVARTTADPPRVVADMQNRLRDLTPPGSRVRTSRWLDGFQANIRASGYIGRLFSVLGVAALALAAAGLFSVLSYAVSQRMREFAVRMALGARPTDVVHLVVRNAMVMTLGGTALGAGAGMWSGFLIWNLLWGVYPVDAEALIIAEVTLLLATLAACAVPALRATRANPVDVMRAT
jgi:predicted permease